MTFPQVVAVVAAGIAYPPERFVLVGFKFERELHLLAYGPERGLTFIRSYPILGASGTFGPKPARAIFRSPRASTASSI
jgi:murein L,D-transpeptidase YafK